MKLRLIPAFVLLALLASLTALAQDGSTPYRPDNQLDINIATSLEVHALPIPGELADAIIDYRTYVAYFGSVFDLLEVDGMTAEQFVQIKDLVFIKPLFQIGDEETREEERRVQERYYLVQRWLSQEGSSEGLVDSYLDQLKDPRNINHLNFYDLVSYQNVSPIDALAILREKEQSGEIENTRQLRSSSGLTYWGYRNIRDFVRYDDSDVGKNRIRGDYQFRIYNTPYTLDDLDNLNESIVGSSSQTDFDLNTYAGRLNLGTSNPYLTNKLRLRYGKNLKGAVLTHRNLGEKDWNETAKFFLEVENLPTTTTPLGDFQLHGAVAGNYTLSFGQGLVMDATDFFMPRRTGHGFSIRPTGLRGDLSRSDEYTLKGVAAEASLGRLRGTVFYSSDDKDAILNPDGSFNSYIAGEPRISNEIMDEIRADIEDGTLQGTGDPDAFLPMRDVMDEQVVGGNLKVEIQPGTYVGLTGVEMRYKNNIFSSPGAELWDPNPGTLFLEPDRRLIDRDSEIFARYDSRNLGNYRRVWGAEGQTVFSNLSLAAEYGKLETAESGGTLDRIFSDGPDAFIANAYLQYDNFNFVALYRDYDMGYDNPYNRAFSEDAKFEQTLLDGNPFRLKNPYWASLGLGNPQPKGEQGFYFSTRYQVSRQLTITGLEFDSWKRKSDGADQQRITLRAEYRPVFPVRFRIRHRMSSRHEQRPEDLRNFSSWDSRIEMRVNLSDFDQMRFLYSTSNVKFAARGRLSGPPFPGDTREDSTATRGIPARAIQASLTHNFNPFLSATVSTEIYDGFLYNFEDNEFVVVDGVGYRNWLLVRSRLSSNLSWRFKWTTDHQLPRTYLDIRSFGDPDGAEPEASNAREDRTSYRFQLDYSF